MKAYFIADDIINLEEVQYVSSSKASGNLYFYFRGREGCVIANCDNPDEEIKKIYNLMVGD